MKAAVLALALGCALATPSPAQILSGSGTAVIDGVIDNTEWIDAAAPLFPVNTPGGTTPGGLFVMNDATHLYLGLVVVYTDGIVDFGVEFDASGDQVLRGAGDDAIGLASNGSPRDAYRTVSTAPSDTSGGGTLDVVGAVHVGENSTTIELSHPLDGGDPLDIAVAVDDLLRFGVRIAVFPGGYETHYPGPTPTESARIEIVPEPGSAPGAAVAGIASALLARGRRRREA